jgi:dTDP-4-amino-4,6-dideoxygalactose transaminase
MKKPVKDMSLMHDDSENIVMFYPHVSKLAKTAVMEVLDTRWIGQGPKVKLFEESFSNKFASNFPSIAVGSGTDALRQPISHFCIWGLRFFLLTLIQTL